MSRPLALVIDDEPDICELLTLTLGRMEIETETAEDVASAVLFFASSAAAKTTGAMLPVDGGLREAFPR